ncbi:hypothetical protein scyTo_0024228, partial [Scyliorhinus torazame]|nr:hypothetical protein [Scyliorhinus torazame]
AARKLANLQSLQKDQYHIQTMDCEPQDLKQSMVNNFCEVADWEERDFEGADVKDMRVEAEAVVNDVNFAVRHMAVSKSLPVGEDVAYINVETKEGNKYCLELTEAGLRVRAALTDTNSQKMTGLVKDVFFIFTLLSPLNDSSYS